jgi:hypothetical protein
MTKQGNGARLGVSKKRDTAVVDFPPIRITATDQRAFKARCFRKSLTLGKFLMGHTYKLK